MASPTARRLRRNPTDTERNLWSLLRQKQLAGVRFRRQQPISRYVVDFFCASYRLVVEVDGGQHDAADPTERGRTAWLESRGYRVLRFWNNDMLSNPEGVVETIRRAVANQSGETPHPDPPPQGGRVRKPG